MQKKELYAEYEKILLGKRRNYNSSLFDRGVKKNQENACEIMRYAFFLLDWTPQDVAHCTTFQILKLMKIDVLMKYIDFPEELNKKEDLFYLAHILYPTEIHFNTNEIIEKTFKKVLNKELYSFPKRYFLGENGSVRLRICFITYLREKCNFRCIPDIYAHFSSPAGTSELKKCYLIAPCKDIYETPVDLIHDALADNQKDDLSYSYFKFKYLYHKEAKAYRAELKAAQQN